MPPKSLKTLEDIRDAAEFIFEITAQETLKSYRKNRMLRQAVERNFEIIGEAVRRLRGRDPATADNLSHHAQIVSFRNALIHGYDLVDDELVWDTIKHHLPRLLAEVQGEMQRLSQGGSAPPSPA